MPRRICLALGLLCLATPVAAQAPAYLYPQAKRVTVEILVDRRLAGSGTIVDREGLILTAAHLFGRGKQQVEVLLDRKRHKAALIALDLGHDLALVQLPKRADGYPFAALAEEPLVAGEQIFLLGAPMFRHRVMFPGMVARDDSTYEYVLGHYVEVIHVAASSPQGVSGGPWFNRRGRLVGVQSSMMTVSSAPQGVAFVAPLAAARRLIERRASAQTATLELAVEELWEQAPDTLAKIPQEVRGLYIRICNNKGAGGRAGLAVGQVITSVEGKPVRQRDDFARLLRQNKPGEILNVKVWTPEGTREISASVAPLEWELSTQSD